jgi:hypothetical protein
MKIGKDNRLEWIMERHWERFAGEINIRPMGVLAVQLRIGSVPPQTHLPWV